MSTADIIGSLLASAADALLDEPARRHALGQVKLLQAPPEVVRPAVPLLLRLLEDPAADVRRMALALVEDAGRSCPSTIPELLPALLTRLSDESAPTLKRALAAATSLLRPTLVLLLAEKDEAAAKALEPTWGHLRKLRETAGTLLNAASAADSVRTAAVKACEALVLAYTDEPEDEGTESAEGPPGADVTSGGSGWRLSALPAAAALEDGNGANRGVHVGEGGTSGAESSGNEGGGETGSEGAAAITASEESKLGKRPPHPLLERAALEAEGEATLTLLETTLLAPPSATVLLVLLTSIAALARQRRVLLQRLSRTLAALSRALLERAASLAALPSHQVANAQQSLRAALLTLLKTTRAREDRAVEEELATALRHLGANEQLKHLGATEVGGAQGGAAKTGETASPSRYDVLAMSLLPRLRRALPPNARAAVLLDVPKLMSEWLSKLIELEGEEMWRPGLAAYRELAMQRDALGPACLRALLQVATSAGESAGEAERRAHAVKIVTAQLLPLPRFASLIGGFAEAQLRRLVGASTTAHPTASCVGDGMDVSSDGEMAEDSWAIKSHQEGEENEDILTAHVQLYLAVVAKEPARLWPLLAHFGGASAGAQAVLVRNAPLLVPHIDPVELASLLVRAMREIRPLDPSAPLILALLTAVAAGSPTGSPPAPPAPPAALVEGTLELCCTELRDGRYAVPLLPFAPRPLVESVLPRLLGMAPETASAALAALMHAKPPPLPPAHLLLLLHQLPSDGSAGVSLKQLIDGVQACLAEKSVFTMQVVADALQLIVHLDPLPLIFMRTTIQALLYHPLLAQFTMGLLHHLISRQIWTSPRLWTGFVKCCQQGMPHSLPVMLALPAPQLLEIIEQQPELRPMLISYGAMHLSEVDDDVKEALGLTEEEEVLDI
eukprot:jgi/Chrpa1/19743/Chrysochromulina_OHIO_Genome00008101-RA